MAAGNTDPIDWGVDEVVAFLCNPESAPWAQSVTSARPDPVALEAALRENIVGGEALLNDVDSNALKHDLGVKALGHRSSIMRAIEWLRLQSPTYQMSRKSRSLDELATIGTNTSSLRSTPAPAPFSSAAPICSKPTETVVPPTSSDNTRRIAPTLITGSDAYDIRQEAARLTGGLPPNVTLGTPLLGHNAPTADTVSFDDASAKHKNHRQLPLHDSNTTNTTALEVNSGWFTTALEEDILRRHPPRSDDDDVLPVYGDSGSENDYDSEEWQEILDEQPHLANVEPDPAQPQPSAYLSADVVESLVSQYIEEQKELWEKETLPKELPYARPLWERSREGDNLERLTEETSTRLLKLDQTLSKFKKAIFDCRYRSEGSVRHSCQCLDQTLVAIFLDRWRLSILEETTCPPAIDLPPSASRIRKRRTKSVHSINSLHSEDLASSSESDSWSGNEDMADFIVEDTDADMEQLPAEPQPGIPFMLASSPSSGAPDAASHDGMGRLEDESDSPAQKRQRVSDSDKPDDVFGHTGFSLELVPVFGQTDPTRPRGSVGLGGTQDAEDADAMDIGTPPLNLVSPGSAAVSVQSGASLSHSQAVQDAAQQSGDADAMDVGTPLLNSVFVDDSQDASLAERLPPVIQPFEPASKLPSSGALSEDDPELRGGDPSLQTRPPGEPDDRRLPVNLDDLDLFDMVATMGLKRIELEKNRIHLLAKIVLGLTEDELKSYPPFLNKYYVSLYEEFVQEALRAMLNNQRHVEGRDPDESKLAMRMGALFVSWHHCITLHPMESHKRLVQDALDALIDEENMFAVFFERLKQLVGAARVWRRKSGPPPNAQSAEDDAEPQPRLLVKFRIPKRKRSSGIQAVSSQQKEAQDRQARQEKARETLRRQREKEGLSNHDPAGQAVTFKEPIIYLHPHIGQLVKPHQLTGIQFMWRELIEADKPQGCLLAHVMGLGKTMQV